MRQFMRQQMRRPLAGPAGLAGPAVSALCAVLLLLGASAAAGQDGAGRNTEGEDGPGAANGGLENTLYFSIEAELIVSDREAAGVRLAEWAEAEGGFFVHRSLERVVIRFPDTEVSAFRALLQEEAESVTRYNPSAQNVAEQLRSVRSSIAALEETLATTRSYLDQSDLSGTLALERELRDLLSQLEELKSRRAELNSKRRFARAEVALSTRSRTIPDDIPSSFDWLERVDLYRFLEESR